MSVDELQSPSERTAPRRQWIAVALSLLTAGLGHLYAGSPRRALLAWIVAQPLSLGLLVATMLLAGRAQLPLIVVLTIGVPVAIAADAARAARAQALAYRLRRYNRWYLYAAVALLTIYVVQPAAFVWAKTHVAQAYRLPSGAMEPTLMTGDYILATPLRRSPARGQLVVYSAPGGSFVKRVVGLPGDTLAMRDGQLVVNGLSVREPYARAEEADPVADEFEWQRKYLTAPTLVAEYRPSLRNWGPLVVPSGQYFILGDNRGSSLDSRYVGFIPVDSIVARPTVVYFSRDAETGSIRWSRIGRPTGE